MDEDVCRQVEAVTGEFIRRIGHVEDAARALAEHARGILQEPIEVRPSDSKGGGIQLTLGSTVIAEVHIDLSAGARGQPVIKIYLEKEDQYDAWTFSNTAEAVDHLDGLIRTPNSSTLTTP